jgi:hypothetical protein
VEEIGLDNLIPMLLEEVYLEVQQELLQVLQSVIFWNRNAVVVTKLRTRVIANFDIIKRA